MNFLEILTVCGLVFLALTIIFLLMVAGAILIILLNKKDDDIHFID